MAATAVETQKAIHVENSALKTLKIKKNEKAKGLVELEFIDNKIFQGFNLSVYSKIDIKKATVTELNINLFLRFKKDAFKDSDQKSIAETILNNFQYCAKLNSSENAQTEFVFDLTHLSPTHIKYILTELYHSINHNADNCADFTDDLALLINSLSFPWEINSVETFYKKFVNTGNIQIDDTDARRSDLETRFQAIKEKTTIGNQKNSLYTNQALMLLGLDLQGMGLYDQALQCYKDITNVEEVDIDPKFYWKAQYLIAEILNSRFKPLKAQSLMQTATTTTTAACSNTATTTNSAIAPAMQDTAASTQHKVADKENADQKGAKDTKTSAKTIPSNTVNTAHNSQNSGDKIASLDNYIFRGDIAGHSVMMERAKEALSYYIRIGHFTNNELAKEKAKTIIIKYIKLSTTAKERLKKILKEDGEVKHKSALIVEQTVHANKTHEELTKSLDKKSANDTASIKAAINVLFREDNLNKFNERNNKYVTKIRDKKTSLARRHTRTNSCPDASQLRITLTSPKDSDTPTTPNQSSTQNTVQSKSPPPRPARPERPNKSFDFTRAQSASVTGSIIAASASASVSPEASPPASPPPPKPLPIRFRAPSKTGENGATKSPLTVAASSSTAMKASLISSPPNSPALASTPNIPALNIGTGTTASSGKSPEASPPNSARGRSGSGTPAKTRLLPPPPPPSARKPSTSKENSNNNSATNSASNSPLMGSRTGTASNTASPLSQTLRGKILTELMPSISLPAAAATSSMQSSATSAASSAAVLKAAPAKTSSSVLSPAHVRNDSSAQPSAIFISGLRSGIKVVTADAAVEPTAAEDNSSIASPVRKSIAPPPPPPRRPSSEKDSTQDKAKNGSKSPSISATPAAGATTVPVAPSAPIAPPLTFSSENSVNSWKKSAKTNVAASNAASSSATAASSATVSSSATSSVKSADTSHSAVAKTKGTFADKKMLIAAALGGNIKPAHPSAVKPNTQTASVSSKPAAK